MRTQRSCDRRKEQNCTIAARPQSASPEMGVATRRPFVLDSRAPASIMGSVLMCHVAEFMGAGSESAFYVDPEGP